MGLPSLLVVFHDCFPKLQSEVVVSEALNAGTQQLRKELWKHLSWRMNVAKAETICTHEWFVWKVVASEGSCKQIELAGMILGRAVLITHSLKQ